jgi:hypothetical protein
MRNSKPDAAARPWRRVERLLVVSSVLVAACSTLPAANQTQANAPAPDCVVEGNANTASQNSQVVSTLRQAVERGPLYEIAARSGVASCRIGQDSDAIRLEYLFRDGTTLRATRNLQIEYSDQELRLATPLGENPVPVLTRAERAAFGEKGCGINWRQPESKPAADNATVTETVYRGDTCNCQARTRTDAAGRVLTMSLRSAC